MSVVLHDALRGEFSWEHGLVSSSHAVFGSAEDETDADRQAGRGASGRKKQNPQQVCECMTEEVAGFADNQATSGFW